MSGWKFCACQAPSFDWAQYKEFGRRFSLAHKAQEGSRNRNRMGVPDFI
jgi:hypothetical protein